MFANGHLQLQTPVDFLDHLPINVGSAKAEMIRYHKEGPTENVELGEFPGVPLLTLEDSIISAQKPGPL